MPTNHSNDSSELNVVGLSLQQFNFTCRVFTAAMAIKNQLQNALFREDFFIGQNDGLVRVNNTKDISNLNNVLEYLQTLTDILQDIEVCTQASSRACCMWPLYYLNQVYITNTGQLH